MGSSIFPTPSCSLPFLFLSLFQDLFLPECAPALCPQSLTHPIPYHLRIVFPLTPSPGWILRFFSSMLILTGGPLGVGKWHSSPRWPHPPPPNPPPPTQKNPPPKHHTHHIPKTKPTPPKNPKQTPPQTKPQNPHNQNPPQNTPPNTTHQTNHPNNPPTPPPKTPPPPPPHPQNQHPPPPTKPPTTQPHPPPPHPPPPHPFPIARPCFFCSLKARRNPFFRAVFNCRAPSSADVASLSSHFLSHFSDEIPKLWQLSGSCELGPPLLLWIVFFNYTKFHHITSLFEPFPSVCISVQYEESFPFSLRAKVLHWFPASSGTVIGHLAFPLSIGRPFPFFDFCRPPRICPVNVEVSKLKFPPGLFLFYYFACHPPLPVFISPDTYLFPDLEVSKSCPFGFPPPPNRAKFSPSSRVITWCPLFRFFTIFIADFFPFLSFSLFS